MLREKESRGLETEAELLAKAFCKNLTVWKIPGTQMDSKEVDYAAGAVCEEHFEHLSLYHCELLSKLH